MSSKAQQRSIGLVVQVAFTAALLSAAGAPAQAYPPPQDAQDGREALPPEAYTAPPYDTAPYPAPPAGYDGRQVPPPPPGYQPQGDAAAQVTQDRQYAAYVQDWSARYCAKAHSNAGVGAVLGGVFGALLGSSVAGWHDRGTGALVGGIAGAAGGAAVGGTSANATSPGCPPGFVVRRDAPAFYYEGYGSPYLYAAPGWYQPWFFYNSSWSYRPYPYHVWYYGRFGYGGFGRGYGRGFGYGRGYGRGFRR